MVKHDTRFATFFLSIRKEDLRTVRSEIIKQCGIHEQSLYRWKDGKATPTLERRKVINTIALEHGYALVYPNNGGYKKKHNGND